MVILKEKYTASIPILARFFWNIWDTLKIEKVAEEKGFVFHTGVYYNIDGEIAIEFSEYNGKRIYFCDSFYNGYALMLIEGTDQLTYFMVIIKAENFSLNPKWVLTMCI